MISESAEVSSSSLPCRVHSAYWSGQARPGDNAQDKSETIGQPIPHIEVKIVDPASGETLPVDAPGELCPRGFHVMMGYYDLPQATAATIDADGWLHTGDLCTMDARGYCRVTGRLKDLIIRGGENIYPREIEEFLYTHPDVEDVQVVGVPDEKYGEELCAWVRLRPGANPLDADGVRAFATGKLAHYKIPRYVLLVDEFPMTVTGKIRKVEMREKSTEILGLG